MSILRPQPIPKYGDLMTMKDFIHCCETGAFIDYDGHGHYSDGTQEFVGERFDDGRVKPSMVKKGLINTSYSHIIWFNR